MGASRSVWLALLAGGLAIAGCDAIIGLDSYSVVSCAFDCGTDAPDDVATSDGAPDHFTVPPPEGGPEAGDADATVDAGDSSMDADAYVADVSIDVPLTLLDRLWARWPMPNPDAAIAPESSTSLPNQTTYTVSDAGKDAAVTVKDTRSGLTWYQDPLSADSAAQAEEMCQGLGHAVHAPSRIQLVSLVDFTRSPTTIDTHAFPSAKISGAFWAALTPQTDAGYTVNFSTGLASPGGGARYVLCVVDP